MGPISPSPHRRRGLWRGALLVCLLLVVSSLAGCVVGGFTAPNGYTCSPTECNRYVALSIQHGDLTDVPWYVGTRLDRAFITCNQTCRQSGGNNIYGYIRTYLEVQQSSQYFIRTGYRTDQNGTAQFFMNYTLPGVAYHITWNGPTERQANDAPRPPTISMSLGRIHGPTHSMGVPTHRSIAGTQGSGYLSQPKPTHWGNTNLTLRAAPSCQIPSYWERRSTARAAPPPSSRGSTTAPTELLCRRSSTLVRHT
jgi:hypothetical protein